MNTILLGIYQNTQVFDYFRDEHCSLFKANAMRAGVCQRA
jgi:hypothetical protein